MLVLKFGGTSVGSAENIKKTVTIITNIVEPKIVVLSAVSGTTNTLITINSQLRNHQREEALLNLDKLAANYQKLIKNLYKTLFYKEKGLAFVSSVFDEVRRLINCNFSNNIEKIVVAQGEILSTSLVQLLLEEMEISSQLISALDFMQLNELEEPKTEYISEKLLPILNKNQQENIWITQGFICRNSFGKLDNLKRGGSDYTASLIAAAINAKEVQIWTDISGMHNNDPRYVANTFSIKEISFDEAAELAYFGAKILHPQSLIPVKEKNIPVLLKNTFKPEDKGTLIKNKRAENGVRAIAAKDGITAIKIKSYRMLLAYGFLKNVFEVFEKHQTPIDMIATSEVSISLTIDDRSSIFEIQKELQPFGKVIIDSDLSIICVVGGFSQNEEGLSAKVFNALKSVPIRMISYGGSNNNISFLVKTIHKSTALNLLNKKLFKG